MIHARQAAAGLVVALAVVTACRRPQPAPVPEPAEPPIAEESLPPTGRPAFEIAMIDWTKSEDGRELFVEGRIRNTGTAPSQTVKVWVDALDADGARVARAEVLPTPQTIAPGGAARFVVRLPNAAAIRNFQFEAIGR